MLKCTICDIGVNSVSRIFSQVCVKGLGKLALCSASSSSAESDLMQHLRGRAHFKGLERKAVTERSIYIRGFPKDVSQDSLHLFISQSLGAVKNLWLSKSIPPYALVEFNRADDALKALQIPGVCFNGNKLVIKPRNFLYPPAKVRPVKKAHEDKMPVEMETSEVARSDAVNWESRSADHQLQSLSESIALPLTAIKKHLVITFHLLQLIRPLFPRCMIIPFGSAISGLGTVTSDCDLSFFTDPPASLGVLLSGNRYFSHPLLSIVKKLEAEYGITLCSPQSASSSQPTKDMVGILSSSSSSLSAKTLLNPKSSVFDQINTILTADSHLRKVYAISKARCPIIKFVHNPTNLSCDISVDSYLGVLNTRLMKAYCEFDERVVILVRVLKLWTREHGFPKNHFNLNSYTLSLMMVFALQQCLPPVLPCLQGPGQWPKNMQWYKQKQPSLENDLDYKLVDYLNVTFTPPQSLKPSRNIQSTANLLLHFFKFYATVFDSNQHAVCVRSSAVLSKVYVAKHARKMYQNSDKKVLQFFEPLIVQDPFDLSHNVARSLHHCMLRQFQKICLLTANKLQDELACTPKANSLKPLFTKMDEVVSSSSSSSSTTRPIDISFSPVEVSKFLHCTYQSLVDRLEELDWTNIKVQSCLGKLLLAEVVQLLFLKFGFICEGNMEEQEPSIYREERENEVISIDGPEDHEVVGMELQVTSVEPVISSGMKRKRSLSDQSVEEEAFAGKHGKRSRAKEFGPGALDVLYSYLAERHYPHSYTCTALSRSWVNTRRARRELLHQQHEGETSSLQSVVMDALQQQTSSSSSEAMEVSPCVSSPPPPPDEALTNPSTLEASADSSLEEASNMFSSSGGVPGPVLQLRFGLASANTTDTLVTLQATALQGQATDFYTLFAVLKKLIKQ